MTGTSRLAPGVRLALFGGWFASCAEEMGLTLMRAAYSPNIKERLDHSCAIFDAQARLVAQGREDRGGLSEGLGLAARATSSGQHAWRRSPAVTPSPRS